MSLLMTLIQGHCREAKRKDLDWSHSRDQADSAPSETLNNSPHPWMSKVTILVSECFLLLQHRGLIALLASAHNVT